MKNIIFEEGDYRILEIADLDYNIADLKGDGFDPIINSDIDPEILKIEEYRFDRKIVECGVYGYVLEKWNPAPGQGWQHVDSCWGFVGQHEQENHYIVAEFLEQIEREVE